VDSGSGEAFADVVRRVTGQRARHAAQAGQVAPPELANVYEWAGRVRAAVAGVPVASPDAVAAVWGQRAAEFGFTGAGGVAVFHGVFTRLGLSLDELGRLRDHLTGGLAGVSGLAGNLKASFAGQNPVDLGLRRSTHVSAGRRTDQDRTACKGAAEPGSFG
jgi:hypothetical protein